MICYIYLSINQSIFLSFFGGELRMSNPMGYDQPWSTSPVLATITGVVLCNKQSNINTKSSSTGVFGVTSTGQSSPNTVKPQNKTPAKITLENTAITTEGCRNCTVKNPYCFPAPKMKFSLPGTNSGDWNSVLRCLGTEILQLCCRRCWRLMYNSALSHWYGEMIKENQGWGPTSCKWSYKPHKWSQIWVTVVITPISGVITLLTIGRGPSCRDDDYFPSKMGIWKAMARILSCHYWLGGRSIPFQGSKPDTFHWSSLVEHVVWNPICSLVDGWFYLNHLVKLRKSHELNEVCS